ncbi:uncharacterized protein CBO05P1_147 [Clostridium botulinum B str. Osaka05]|uniref:Uncharacterized protein n=1 Tax=Clostridium botulinum B str. Osaka05 TaxID=1407017 RepID=A0A060N355_CLOBO|nr:DUF4149 domain-containing protein [Clostridium botulinum]BAO04866.1 uncharacterized protein CBO05P1_147 [Clostridium botulinum B str. Osaka05]
MDGQSFITGTQAATFGGCTFMTFIVVQLLKEAKPFKNMQTKYFATIVGILNVFFTSLLFGDFNVAQIYLIIINGILVAINAMGVYNAEGKKKDKEIQTIDNFYTTEEPQFIAEDNLTIATDTNEFDSVIKNQNEIKG